MDDYKNFNTPESVHDWLEEAYPKKDLDYFDLNKQPVFSPLLFYTGSMSKSINYLLRRGIQQHPTYHFEHLQADLLAQELPDNIVTYRFISSKELYYLWSKTLFGKTFKNPCFISTTLLPNQFNGQSKGHISITLYAPKGYHGIYITELKNAITEYEVLFAHGIRMKRKSLFEYELLL